MVRSLGIEGLSVEFADWDSNVSAVENLTLDVAKGEILGIVGESGAGKSSVGAAVIDLVEPPGKTVSGTVRLGDETLPLGKPGIAEYRGRRIGFIFQDPLSSLDPLFTVGEQLCETLRILRPGCAEREEAIGWLRSVGIPEPEVRVDDYPHQFSGGMRQRAVIALALAGRPSLLIADEPTTALDVSIQAQILKLIRDLAKDKEIGVLLISHDIGVVSEVSDRIAVMRYGKLLEVGATADMLARPQSRYARQLFSAIPPSDRTIKRFVRFADAEESDAEMEGRKARLLASWERPALGDKSLLSVEGICKTFGGGWFAKNQSLFKALDDVSFRISSGESLGLVGESGSGKSTAARIVCGLASASVGKVLFCGKPYVPGPKPGGIQMIFQDPYSSLNPRLRVEKIVDEPLRPLRLGKLALRSRVGDLLALTGLPADAMRRYPHEFSGGQRQRIAIARALASEPRLLVCDEPTSALDVSIQAQILNLLKDLQDELGLSMLFISHDLPVVRQMCSRIGVLRGGQLLEISPTDELFSSPRHEYTRTLLELMPKVSPPNFAEESSESGYSV